MGIDKVTLFNLALSACGAEIGVADPDERSREAALCRLWFPQVRDMTLAAAPWPCARAYARLALLASAVPEEAPWQPGDPTPGFTSLYAVPSDLLHPYHLATYERFEYTSKTISTRAHSPVLFYNRRVEDLDDWDQGFIDAVVYSLAARIARPLTGSGQVVQENYQLALSVVQNAQTDAANINELETESLPDWLQARGTDLQTPTRFLYPWQNITVERLQ